MNLRSAWPIRELTVQYPERTDGHRPSLLQPPMPEVSVNGVLLRDVLVEAITVADENTRLKAELLAAQNEVKQARDLLKASSKRLAKVLDPHN